MDGAQIVKNAVDPYWFFANEVSEDICKKIIGLAKKDWRKATVNQTLILKMSMMKNKELLILLGVMNAGSMI